MNVGLNTDQNLSQKLSISPQIRQSLSILGMSSHELTSYIEEQFLDNPVIEIEPKYDELEYEEKLKRKLEWLDNIDEHNRVYAGSLESDDNPEFPYPADEEPNLQDHLISQLNFISLHSDDYTAAKYIIYSLDENGFLKAETKDIARRLHTTDERIESLIKLVQSMDPAGVGARNMSECLSLQLRRLNIKSRTAFEIINRHLDKLAANRLDAIAKELGTSVKEVKKHTALIRTLNPKPGSAFAAAGKTVYIRPDIIVVKFKDYYDVLVNDLAIPGIHINSYYKSVLNSSNDTETVNYISEKIRQASLIVKCITQRNNTLKNIAKAIINMQKEFFRQGPGHLAPLRLRDVAEELRIHESTVSRAINKKYLQCSWGIFSMKYFFPSSLQSPSTHKTSSDEVKQKLLAIVKSENRKHPYSDRKISEILKSQGCMAARRTISKYREALGIPNASLRREY
jgi:RNA polymerase sigma-54 factor